MANHQTKILAEAGCFMLVQRKKDTRRWYEIKCNAWTLESETEHEIRDFFDPTRNKSGKWGSTWKYRSRREAEQMFLTATLRWAGHDHNN
jgi:hypothetical protein